MVTSGKKIKKELEDKGVELILSILLAVSLAQSLNLFISLPQTKTWLITSLVILAITIAIVYLILDLKLINRYRDLTRIITILLFVFLPFSLQRTFIPNIPEQFFEWNLTYVFIHIIVMGISLCLWGNAEYKIAPKEIKSKALYLTGVFTIIFGLLAFAFI